MLIDTAILVLMHDYTHFDESPPVIQDCLLAGMKIYMPIYLYL